MTDARRDEWLRRRREFLTASDVAAVMGEDPRRGPFAVWAEKVHGYEQAELRIMRRGRLMEPVIAAEYAEETEREVFEPDPFELVVHPSIPWLAATPDRFTIGSTKEPAPAPGRAPVELKNVAGVKAAEWREEPPTQYQIQAQIQISCTGAAWGSLCGMIAGAVTAWKDLLPHAHFLANAYPVLDAFWLQVKRREAPDLDALPGTTAAIKSIFSDTDGTTAVLDREALDLVEAWKRAELRQATSASEAQEIENRLRVRLGAAAFGALPDGRYLSLKRTNVRGYTRTVEPHSYRALRIFRPRIPSRRRE